MSERVWYRSLYWRIAFGFVALLAMLLAAQGLLFLWLTGRTVGPSSRTPAQLAAAVSADLSAALSNRPDLPLDTYIRKEFGHIYQPFLVLLNDGRTASNRPAALPPGFLRGRYGPNRLNETASDMEVLRSRRHRDEVAPIVVRGAEVGVVGVPGNPPPPSVALRELAPVLGWSALGLLAVGSTIMALLIFGPVHRRLRSLDEAATALGQGRTDVRAVEGGGDEVSALARTFNRMADDRGTRAAELQASDRTRRQLLADVSHELMTPLAAIRGYIETLAMPEIALDDPTRRKYLEIVGEETQKLEALIGDLLDLARLEGEGGSLVSRQIPVSELFGRVVDRHGSAIRERHLTVDVHVDPPNLSVMGDPQRLEQALQNLAANAIRHTPAEGRLELGAEVRAGAIRISVRDTGDGIPDEHLARVFDRFYKADASRTVTSTPSGSGLGLSIVRAIVERHGGAVTAANAPERGAIFEIVLPAS